MRAPSTREKFSEESSCEEGSGGEKKTNSGLGGKSFTFIGSIILTVNNIVGPAIVAYPLVFQLAGFIPTSLYTLVTFFLCAFAGTMLCEAMQRIPGNYDFSARYEFSSTMGHYWGRKGEIIGQILVNICLQANNIASIIIAAQVMDDFLIFLFHHTYAVHLFPPYGYIDVTAVNDKIFEGEAYVLSLGYVVCAVICMPFGYFNLDDNIYFQWFSFIGCFGTLLEFYFQFAAMPFFFDWSPMWGTDAKEGQAMVLGVVIFSCAYVITIPSWVNEKQDHVSVNKSIWYSSIIGMLVKFIFGWFAACTYKNEKRNANILNVMTTHASPGAFGLATKICVYLFNVSAIIPGIPVYSILTRYNLVTSKIANPFVSNLFAVVLPWLMSMFFYHGSGFSNVVNWSALVFQGVVNFVLPCLLYYKALRMYPEVIVPPQFTTTKPPKKLPEQETEQKAEEKDTLGGEEPILSSSSTSNSDTSEHIDGKEIDALLNRKSFSLNTGADSTVDLPDGQEEKIYVPPVDAVPDWLRVSPTILALVIAVIMSVLSLGTIVGNIYLLAIGNSTNTNTTNGTMMGIPVIDVQ